MPDTFTVPARDELIWLGVDLDGTLAKDVWPDTGIGEPIWENVTKLDLAICAGYKVVIYTSRSWEMYETIEAWLNHWDIPWHRIVCGKLLVRAMIDDRAINAAEESWVPND